MDPYSSPYIIMVSMFFSVPSFPANQRQDQVFGVILAAELPGP